MRRIDIVMTNVEFGIKKKRIIHGVSMTYPSSSITCLLGPNGAGKTTIARLVAGLTEPSGGVIAWQAPGGAPVVRAGADIAYVPQHSTLDGRLTGREHAELFASFSGLRKSQARSLIEQRVKESRLGEWANGRIDTYSGGVQRRFDIMTKLSLDRPVLILDEPSAGLDPISRKAVWAELHRLRAQGATLLVLTQDVQEAEALANRVVVLRDGRIISSGSIAEVTASMPASKAELEFATQHDFDLAVEALEQNHADRYSIEHRDLRVTLLSNDSPAELAGPVFALLADLKLSYESIAFDRPGVEDIFSFAYGEERLTA